MAKAEPITAEMLKNACEEIGNTYNQPTMMVMHPDVFHRLMVLKRYSRYVKYIMSKSNWLVRLWVKFKTRHKVLDL